MDLAVGEIIGQTAGDWAHHSSTPLLQKTAEPLQSLHRECTSVTYQTVLYFFSHVWSRVRNRCLCNCIKIYCISEDFGQLRLIQKDLNTSIQYTRHP